MVESAGIPKLKTARLILRPMAMDDWPDYLDLMQSERSAYMDGPYPEEGAWGMFCHDVAQWGLMGHGALMFDELATGICLGQVGINHGPLFPEHELGWYVYAHAEGKGYALEAARALRDWAYRVRGLKTLVSYIAPENTRSLKLAERLGAVLDPDAPRKDDTILVYRHAR